MKNFVAGHEPVTAAEFAELALGIDYELFAGVPGESHQDQAARLDVAREALKDLRHTHPEDAAYAAALMRTAPLALPRPSAAQRRAIRTENAA